MANTQIPNLTAAVSLTGEEQMEAVQAGSSVRVTTAQIAQLANAATGNVLQPSLGGTGTDEVFTQGSVVFAGTSGVYTQKPNQFFWDNANNYLGVGTNAPTARLHVVGGVLGSSFNNVAVTAPAAPATFALSSGSTFSTGGNFSTGSTFSTTGSFATGGAFSTSASFTTLGAFGVTLTATGTTNLTLPTTGTVTALGNAVTGSGNIVLSTSPSLTTPALGAATALSVNNVDIVSPALLSTLKLASNSTLETSGVGYQTTFAFTGNTSVTFPTSGTVTALGNSTTGTGDIVRATSPTLVTPTLGVASATTVNKVTITAPATGSTLTISDGKTISFPQSLTFPSVAGTNGYVLQTNGSGTLSWVAQSGGGGGGTTPGGSDGQVQYNKAGALGGFDLGGDATISINQSTDVGTLTVTKTNGASFGALATVSAGTGVATAAGNAVNASGGLITYATYAPASGKTLTVSNSMTIAAGADGQTFTFPSSGGTVSVLGNATTGTGDIVRATSPTLITPTLGVASATSLNKLAITAPATSATLSLADGSTLQTTGAYTINFTASGATSLTLPTSGTVTALGNSSTGSGGIVLATSPTLVTPTLGVASASSINKVAITAPASNATLTLADGATLQTTGAYTINLTATGATSLTLPTSGALATTSNKLSAFASTTSAELAGVISDETGSGKLVFATSPTLTTPVLGTATATKVTFDAGTASVAPIILTSGTNLTTAAAGAHEYDGTVFYKTPNASNRGVSPAMHFVILTSSRTLTSNTSAQAIFAGGGGPSNGALTLPTGTYIFEMVVQFSGMSTSAHTLNSIFAGTATIGTFSGLGNYVDTSYFIGSYKTGAASSAISNATTGAAGAFSMTGAFTVTVTGTVIPQISQATNTAAANILAGSYFKCFSVGSSTVNYVGNWS